MEKKNRYLYYSIFYSCLLIAVIGIYAYGWETPSCDPPGCNLPAPINAGLNPQTKEGNLTIGGNLTTGSFTMAAGAGANKVLTTNASGVATWQIPAGGSLWTQTGNNIYYNTGNVGIGTTAPGAKLDVAGDLLVRENLRTKKLINIPLKSTLYAFCSTASTYTGNLGGIAGANNKCVASCGSGFVFATISDVRPGMTAMSSTWYYRINGGAVWEADFLSTEGVQCNVPTGTYWLNTTSSNNCGTWTLSSGCGCSTHYGGGQACNSDTTWCCGGGSSCTYGGCNNNRSILCVKKESFSY